MTAFLPGVLSPVAHGQGRAYGSNFPALRKRAKAKGGMEETPSDQF